MTPERAREGALRLRNRVLEMLADREPGTSEHERLLLVAQHLDALWGFEGVRGPGRGPSELPGTDGPSPTTTPSVAGRTPSPHEYEYRQIDGWWCAACNVPIRNQDCPANAGRVPSCPKVRTVWGFEHSDEQRCHLPAGHDDPCDFTGRGLSPPADEGRTPPEVECSHLFPCEPGYRCSMHRKGRGPSSRDALGCLPTCALDSPHPGEDCLTRDLRDQAGRVFSSEDAVALIRKQHTAYLPEVVLVSDDAEDWREPTIEDKAATLVWWCDGCNREAARCSVLPILDLIGTEVPDV